MVAQVISRDPETQQPTAIRCISCDAKVEVDGCGDVECPRCGQPYNAFGQALRRADSHDPDCPGCRVCC